MISSHIVVVDPGVLRPELRAFNHLVKLSAFPMTYHLPALFGIHSLEKEQSGIKAIIIFGSASSVNDRKDWQVSIEKWLKPKIESGIPTFGICYGHQMLAYMFGGEVSFIFEDKRKLVGVREVNLEPDPLWDNQPISGHVCTSHNEHVTKVPVDFVVIGQSKEVSVDAIRHRTLPVWGVQFHPEALPEFLIDRGICGVEGQYHRFGHEIVTRFLKYVVSK